MPDADKILFDCDQIVELLNDLPQDIIYQDLEHRIIWANNESAKSLNMKVKDLMGKYCYQIRYELNQPCRNCPVIRARTTGNVETEEILSEDGKNWLVKGYPVKDEAGNTYAAVEIAVDISDKKQKMRKYEERMSEEDGELSRKNSTVFFEGIINALGSSVDVRDPYTSAHQRRVANLAFAIGRKMGLSKTRCEILKLTGLIHDIGKLKIPIEILTKPAKLSKLEFEMIKGHSPAGYRILKEIDFPWPIADYVKQHHEKIDGSGYPDGLQGDEIYFESKIITVADVVEAMNSHRPYRPALGLVNALTEIEQNKGILYEPVVVETCISIFRENSGFFA